MFSSPTFSILCGGSCDGIGGEYIFPDMPGISADSGTPSGVNVVATTNEVGPPPTPPLEDLDKDFWMDG